MFDGLMLKAISTNWKNWLEKCSKLKEISNVIAVSSVHLLIEVMRNLSLGSIFSPDF